MHPPRRALTGPQASMGHRPKWSSESCERGAAGGPRSDHPAVSGAAAGRWSAPTRRSRRGGARNSPARLRGRTSFTSNQRAPHNEAASNSPTSITVGKADQAPAITEFTNGCGCPVADTKWNRPAAASSPATTAEHNIHEPANSERPGWARQTRRETTPALAQEAACADGHQRSCPQRGANPTSPPWNAVPKAARCTIRYRNS